jgi:two-component system response regulator NreC
MPGKSGIEVLPTLREVVPDASVIILSMEDDPSYIRAAFELGAKGYLLKEAANDDLMTALEEIAAGREYLHPQLGARMQAVEAAARRREEDDPLSDREREVLRLLALGHTNQEIAKMLFISVRTVESHRAHILTKLRLNTRAELVRYALAEGMLEDIESTDESPA